MLIHLLYEQLTPKALEKLAKKFNCSQGSTTITVSMPKDNIRYMLGAGCELRNIGDEEKTKFFRNEVVACAIYKAVVLRSRRK